MLMMNIYTAFPRPTSKFHINNIKVSDAIAATSLSAFGEKKLIPHLSVFIPNNGAGHNRHSR